MGKRRPGTPLRTDTGTRSKPPAGFYFDTKEAKSAVRFIENRCHHWQEPFAGQRFILEPWQRRLVEDIKGWKRTDGSHRYRWVYVEVPKGNGKTPLGAALILLGLHWSGDRGAELYSVAGDREQARLVYADARGMTVESAELSSRSMLYRDSITVPEHAATYKVLSAEAPTKHGPRPSLVIFDELHVQPNRKLFDTLKSGVGKRPGAQLIMLTTAGEYDEESLCWNEHEYATATVRPENDDNHIDDPAYYAVIYAADPTADPGDERQWKCNPNLGVSVDLEGLRDEYRRAKNIPPELSSFKRLRLNIWAEESQAVIDMAKWRTKCGRPPLCEGPCYLGMDLSSKLDLTAVAAYFPDTHSVLVFYWLPEENIRERARLDVFDYQRYAREGFITLTPGSKVDFGFIRKKVNELYDRFDVIDVGFDSWNATQMETWLAEEDGIPITSVRQGSKTLSQPFKDLVGEVADGELRHGGNPVLTWNASNLRAKRDCNDNWQTDKKMQRKRIDGCSAVINAKARFFDNDGSRQGAEIFVMGVGDETA